MSDLLSENDKALMDYLKQHYPKYLAANRRPNYKDIYCNLLPISLEQVHTSCEEMRRIWQLLRQSSIYEYQLSRGNVATISSKRQIWYGCGWDLEITYTGIELIIMCDGVWRFLLSSDRKKETGIWGYQAIHRWCQLSKSKYGIDMDDYRISNGPEIKKSPDFPKYLVKLDNLLDEKTILGQTIEGVHHIDFHSSFPAGLANTHPEFRPMVKDIYDGRKEDEMNKALLNLSIGAFQSVRMNNACWAHLAKDAIQDNNDRVIAMRDKLLAAGRFPIAFNTDGIWYKGDIYHGEGEGPELGQWENDHTDCRIRFKSKGCYEFIENGEYHPVVRGRTRLDKFKPREDWTWGDIFRDDAVPFGVKWDWELGPIYVEGDDLLDETDYIGL